MSAATLSATDGRDRMRHLRLHGATIYACRKCRTPMRAVRAADLPDECPACGLEALWRSVGTAPAHHREGGA